MKLRRGISVLVLAGLTTIVARNAPHAEQSASKHVVMISIDGLKPSTYTTPGPSKVPTLRRLAAEGAYAEGVVGVTPTVTYPSHTTLVSGVLPAVHGIYNNNILDPEGISNGSWYWYARDIKVATLPSAVKARGLMTAAVSWPATVGADIDHLMPEFGGVTRHPQSLDLLRALSRPRTLLDDYEAQGRALPWPLTDADRTGLAAWIIRAYRPHFTLLHIFETDSAQHTHGPGSPQALAAIEAADAHVQQILSAVNDAGLAERTDIVIVSDHGFLPLERQLQPNHLFKREGLLDVDDAGKIRKWDAYYYGAGGSGFVMLRHPDDAALRERVGTLLRTLAADRANGILTVLNQDDLRARGGDPRASFWIDMQIGFYSGSGHDVLLTKTTSKGGHGFAPTRPELHASLVLRGPDVPKAGNLGVVRMTQIAPTIASWLDVALSPGADAPLGLRAVSSR